MRNRKFKYLFQLIYTSILLVIVPLLFLYIGVWRRSYKEINLLNAEYYQHALSTFTGDFTGAIDTFKNHVIAFSVHSKTSKPQEEPSVFLDGTSKMKEYAYYYAEAIEELREYGNEIGCDYLGVYYYSEDILLVDGRKYTVENYLTSGLKIEEKLRAEFIDFFDKEKYLYNRVLWVPIRNDEGICDAILLGVCTVLGKEREKAIVFCKLGYKDIQLPETISSSEMREDYYVIDDSTGTVLFSVGATGKEQQNLQKIIENSFERISEPGSKVKSRRFYLVNDEEINLTFVIDTANDTMKNRVDALYESVGAFFVYIVIMMLSICAVVIVYNYRPMNKLLKEIKSENKYEFEAILHAWRNQNLIMTEQRMVIMDFLMNQLLYGVPISQKYIGKLGISNRITCYCVFLIENYVLKASEMENIVQNAENTYGTLLFGTDIIGENTTVFIALMENDISIELGEWIEHWAKIHITEVFRVRKGHVVREMNEIRRSFATCMGNVVKEDGTTSLDIADEEKETIKQVKSRTAISNTLKDKVLDYLEEHFTNSEISQQQLADYFHVSVYTLSKVFNNQIGIGFSEYLNSKRIEYAKELLRTTDIPVKKVAVMVGIPNDNYFSKIFKKYTGSSPVAYRENANW